MLRKRVVSGAETVTENWQPEGTASNLRIAGSFGRPVSDDAGVQEGSVSLLNSVPMVSTVVLVKPGMQMLRSSPPTVLESGVRTGALSPYDIPSRQVQSASVPRAETGDSREQSRTASATYKE
jgi:hypothetical protein